MVHGLALATRRAVGCDRRASESAGSAEAPLASGTAFASAQGELQNTAALAHWRKMTCKIMWLIRFRRWWGNIGDHPKLYKLLQ